MNAANDSVRVVGIGRVLGDHKALELNFTGKPSDDEIRRIHDLLRDGPQPACEDDALWAMLVKQAHQRLGIGPDPGESPFDYLQRALQRVRPYGAAVPGPLSDEQIVRVFHDNGVLRIPTRSLDDPDGLKFMVAIGRALIRTAGVMASGEAQQEKRDA